MRTHKEIKQKLPKHIIAFKDAGLNARPYIVILLSKRNNRYTYYNINFGGDWLIHKVEQLDRGDGWIRDSDVGKQIVF